MHTNPVFTDARGRQIKPVLGKSRVVRRFQRIVSLAAIATLSPLVLLGAVTQIDLAKQVRGILAIANGGTGTSSTLTGLVRGSGSAMTAAELSGDVTTSGSNAVTVAKVNGTSVTTNSAADQVILTTGSATGVWKSVPDCPTGALNFTASTHTIGCASVLTGSFADNETPTGTINGSNDTFTLDNTPSPAASLTCTKNGLGTLAGGADYTLSTATITFVAGAIPQTGDPLRCSYRY